MKFFWKKKEKFGSFRHIRKILENEKTAEIFSAEDFSLIYQSRNWNVYTLNNGCRIFGKIFNKKALVLKMNKRGFLKDSIIEISENINWLCETCKEELIEFLNENMKQEERVNDEWYENLEIYSVQLLMITSGVFIAKIVLRANIDKCYTFDIRLFKNLMLKRYERLKIFSNSITL
jgi:hypothetical protein